jgi:teichoic acid transport system ATP-binding protein
MRTRLGFSIASAIRPEILLIDEMLAAGDAEFKERSTARIREMVKEAGTVLIASHSMGTLKQLCNRAILVERGKITQTGAPEEVIATYMGPPQAKAPRRALSAR